MLQPVRVTSLGSDELRWYRTLRRPLEHHLEGIFVAEGENVVLRLLESGIPVISLLLTDQWLASIRNQLDTLEPPPAVYVAEKRLLETIVGFPLHQGIMAVGRIPRPAPLEEIVARSERPFLFVAVDGLTNAENLGVLVRNCAAFGAQALLVGETSSSPYLRRAVRNSMGAVFRLPAVHVGNLAETLRELRSLYGVLSVAAHPSAAQRDITAVRLDRDCCLVFGSEGTGISAVVLEACDEAVALPMENAVDSLNVASACAVFLYAVRTARRRRSM